MFRTVEVFGLTDEEYDRKLLYTILKILFINILTLNWSFPYVGKQIRIGILKFDISLLKEQKELARLNYHKIIDITSDESIYYKNLYTYIVEKLTKRQEKLENRGISDE